jgi:hypothetical protein
MNVLQLINDAMNVILARESQMGETTPSAPTIGSGASTSVALFTGRPLHIPDDADGSYKTEVVIYDGPGGTVKINYWGKKDPRPEAHNHPWKDPETGVSFRATVLAGGYDETVYTLGEDGEITAEKRSYRQGDQNTSLYREFHTVDSVLPGTVTLMVCGPRYTPTNGQAAWGYILPGSEGEKPRFVGANDPAVADPTFFPRFLAINPHRRK